jgi:hypothetical protein
MPRNSLYLAVLPLIHISNSPVIGFGFTEQTLTLFPDKNFATEFLVSEVDGYIETFLHRTKYITGGEVTGYEVFKEQTTEGRVIVRVVQNVT